MNEWDLFWMTWMLFFCVANGVAVLSCVVFMIVHFHEDAEQQRSDGGASKDSNAAKIGANGAYEAPSSCYTPPCSDMLLTKAADREDSVTTCGKRKERDNAYGMTNEMTQGKWKQQRRIALVARVATPQMVTASRFSRTRAFSFNDASALSQQTERVAPLRRIVSCGDVQGTLRQQPMSTAVEMHQYHDAAADSPKHVLLPDLHDSMTGWKTHVRSFVVGKIRKAARNAVDEVLASVFSFMTYATLLFIVRQYSAVAIGVSLDLGAFSIEL